MRIVRLKSMSVGLLMMCFTLAVLITFSSTLCEAQVTIFSIDSGWQFRQRPGNRLSPGEPATPEGVAAWLPARVPGDVHLDLLAQKVIPDPFFGTNEAKLQWISDADWEYQTTLSIPDAMLSSKHIELVFDGIDAYAKVFLNDVLILTSDNQFRPERIDIKPYVRFGPNVLHVVFPAQDRAALGVAKEDPWYPRNSVAAKSYIRKAAYEHGWDWGPTFVTVGLWRSVRLEIWNGIRVRDLHVRQLDLSATLAHLSVEVEVSSDRASATRLELRTITPDGGQKLPPIVKAFTLKEGSNHCILPLELSKPRRWFPAGYGQQPLYDFSVRVISGNDKDEAHTRVGLRTLELRRDRDQWGRSFEFVVNGIPVFAKGADIVPFDSFASRVTDERYRLMLQAAKDANMNMVRLWGGGYYESDQFYDLCDELGLMIWHDFMFGNEWQPGTYEFEQGVEKEAEDQLLRLRDHPSIVLWSGNNETELAFHWSDRDKLPPDVRLQIWQDYLTLFHDVLARTVARLDPDVPYWPSSPSADLEPTSPEFTSGDEHIWDVWHGHAPFATYETHDPRFVSEYGFQSFPDLRTIETFTSPEDRTSISTPVMLAHQKNGEGNALIHEYMLRDYSEPKDFDAFVYVSQILQAEGVKLGAEHFRRDRPRTMGSIYWQLNDCWPVASWSSIDSVGHWKALQFYAKRFYAPMLVSPYVADGALQVGIVSDRTTSRSGSLQVKRLRFDGKVLSEKIIPVDVRALSSDVVFRKLLSELAGEDKDLSQSFIETSLMVADEPTSRNIVYLVATKQIKLPHAQISMDIKATATGADLLIHTDALARSVELMSDEQSASFDDNFFDMLPGETRTIRYISKRPIDQIRVNLHLRSLSDAFSKP